MDKRPNDLMHKRPNSQNTKCTIYLMDYRPKGNDLMDKSPNGQIS